MYERNPLDVARYMARHPRQIAEVGSWLRDLRASPIAARRPWWTYGATRFVGDILEPGMSVFEYGSGGSTLWLSDRGAHVISVEHDPEWHEAIVGLTGPEVSVRLVPPQPTGVVYSEGQPTGPRFFDDYVSAIHAHPAKSLDLVIVDGRSRVACVMAAASKVRPGGRLLLDDSHRARYALSFSILDGWSLCHFPGLRPSVPVLSRTTIWRRPI